MIKVQHIIHIDDKYKKMLSYYLDVSPTILYNYLKDKGKVKYWADGRIVLNTSKDYEIILEVTEVKTIGLEELAEGIGAV